MLRPTKSRSPNEYPHSALPKQDGRSLALKQNLDRPTFQEHEKVPLHHRAAPMHPTPVLSPFTLEERKAALADSAQSEQSTLMVGI